MILTDFEPERLRPEQLVGRIVLMEGIRGWSIYRAPLKVSSLDGNCVLCFRLKANFDGTHWQFTSMPSEEHTILRVDEIKVICDTAEEANRVIQLCREFTREYDSLKKSLGVRLRRAITEFNEATTANEPRAAIASERGRKP